MLKQESPSYWNTGQTKTYHKYGGEETIKLNEIEKHYQQETNGNATQTEQHMKTKEEPEQLGGKGGIGENVYLDRKKQVKDFLQIEEEKKGSRAEIYNEI